MLTSEEMERMQDLQQRLTSAHQQILNLQEQQALIRKELAPLAARYARYLSDQRLAAKRNKEAHSFAEWKETLRVGDVVRVRGTKDARNPFRRVVSIGQGTFTGQKVIKLKGKKEFRDTDVYTTNGIEKIAEKVN